MPLARVDHWLIIFLFLLCVVVVVVLFFFFLIIHFVHFKLLIGLIHFVRWTELKANKRKHPAFHIHVLVSLSDIVLFNAVTSVVALGHCCRLRRLCHCVFVIAVVSVVTVSSSFISVSFCLSHLRVAGRTPSFNISPHIDLTSLTCLNLFYLID